MANDIKFEPIEFEPLNDDQAQAISVLGALGTGVAKGVTFGFDDEIAGIAKAMWDKAGTEDKKDFWDIYKEVRDSVRSYHKKAEDEQPIASFGGELLGALAIPIPGAMAAKGAGVMQKAASMAKIGAMGGALAGAGTSEADLTELNKKPEDIVNLSKDVTGGAASGALIGGTMSALGSLGGLIFKNAKEQRIPKDALKVYNRTLKGEQLTGEKAIGEIGQEIKDVSDVTLERIMGMASEQGAKQKTILTKLDDMGVTLDVNQLYNGIKDSIEKVSIPKQVQRQEVDEITTHVIEQLMSGKRYEGTNYISPTEVNGILQSLNEFGAETDAGKKVVRGIKDAIYKSLNESSENLGKMPPPNIRDAAIAGPYIKGQTPPLLGAGPSPADADVAKKLLGEFRDTKKVLSENIYPFFNKLGIEKPQSLAGARGLEEKEKAVQKLRSMVEDYYKPGSNQQVDLNEALSLLESKYPNDVKIIKDMLSNSSERQYLTKVLQRTTPFTSKGLPGVFNAAMSAKAGKAGELAAKTQLAIEGTAKNASDVIVNTSKKIYDLAPDQLQQLAEAALAKGGPFGEQIGRTLNNIVNAPDAKRKALLFTLMQQPDFRQFVSSYMFGE